MKSDKTLSINLVLPDHSRGWIIEKMAHRLCEALRTLGAEAEVRAQPSAEFTINHFMMFHYVDPRSDTVNTMAVTHVNDALKVDMVRKHLQGGIRAAICMSSMTVGQLASYGIDRNRLTYVLPAHDLAMAPRRIIVGITSHNYSDGRKRVSLLGKLSEDIRLDDFEFQIFGSGWDGVCGQLVAAGANVIVKEPSDDYRADYEEMKSVVPNFDYYLYPGLDEGSLGTLDALSAGVRTIVTTQGFHLDIPNSITHGFWDYGELRKIFEEIIRDRNSRVEVARRLTWRRYAQRHFDIWTSLIEQDMLPPDDTLGQRIERLANKRYPVKSYFRLLCNRYRREMVLRFWLPGVYQRYRDARRKVGRTLRSWKGRVGGFRCP